MINTSRQEYTGGEQRNGLNVNDVRYYVLLWTNSPHANQPKIKLKINNRAFLKDILSFYFN